MTLAALDPNRRVRSVVLTEDAAGDTLTMMAVRLLPPNESRRMVVSLELRYGTRGRRLAGVASAVHTADRAMRELRGAGVSAELGAEVGRGVQRWGGAQPESARGRLTS